ncbi:MAG TPA: CRTAC1 family protein [Lacunisphaera sp.]|nr:CRTAC1 family protein [Lacunisphaera sp.]
MSRLSFALAALVPVIGCAMPPAPGTQRMIERIAEIARKSDPLKFNPYLVAQAAEIYRAKMEAAKTPKEKLAMKFEYGTALLNDGQTTAALKQFEEYDQMLNLPGLEPTLDQAARFLEMKAVGYLRLGEQENCLVNHNADSCLFPIQGGGVHQLPAGSRGAIAVLNDLLAISPNPNAIWLLNIAYMTLGEYPAKVPPQWLIPPATFQSDYDIKHFPDVAGALGLDVDDLAGGVAMDDFDRDGLLDLVVSASGIKSQLRYFHNDGDGRFSERTDAAGLTGLTGGLNLNHTDYNNDGYPDVLVLRGGWQGNEGAFPNSLLRNNRDGTFTDVTEEAGLLSFHPTQTAAWFDYNGDGWLDLFIGNESIPPIGQVHPCELYRNNGDGTFTECAAENGVALTEFVKGVASGDFNNDGRPDLYVSSRGFPNRLLRNDGPSGPDHTARAPWKFTDVAATAGVAGPLQSFPCWFFDYDNDGWLDIFVSGYFIVNAGDIAADAIGAPSKAERARLYHNNRDGTFADVTKETGLYKVLHTMGSNFGDLDNDGWQDFYLGTGDPYLGTLIPNRMFRNDGGRRFQDVTTSGGFGQLQKGHAIAFGDLNNDGTQDIYSVVGGVYTGDHYHNQLFANPGHGNHWLKLTLTGVQSNRAAVGARLRLVIETEAGPREIHRMIGTGGSFGGNPLRQDIGLGQATKIVKLEVFWPRTGRTQVIDGLQLDRAYAITEDQPKATEARLTTFAWPTGGENHHHHHAADGAK